jgi:hypothetical protein
VLYAKVIAGYRNALRSAVLLACAKAKPGTETFFALIISRFSLKIKPARRYCKAYVAYVIFDVLFVGFMWWVKRIFIKENWFLLLLCKQSCTFCMIGNNMQNVRNYEVK